MAGVIILIILGWIAFKLLPFVKAAKGRGSGESSMSELRRAMTQMVQMNALDDAEADEEPKFNLGSMSSRGSASKLLDSSHYHAEGYDFDDCFSFRDVPPGRDELEYLIRYNNRQERKLQKLLQTRD